VREVRKKIGYISPNLIEKLTLRDPVWEIVAGGAFAFLRIYEEVADEIREQAYIELERVGMRAVAEQPFGTLSQGERKKVLLARTMMASPDLLILDEPCAGLDLYERERFLHTLSELSAQKLSMLYVTHHIEEIVPVFTHVALMAQGQIVASGLKQEVLMSEKLEEAYNLPLSIKWQEGRPWIQVGKVEQ
jgi:iron complex transport system ATP-binding protein